MAVTYGIDVSKHQGVIDWNAVKMSGKVDFAILRAGYGVSISQKDQQFENNYRKCKENSIPVGCYWYSYAMSPSEAEKEAETCLQVIKGKLFEYPVYFDIEEDKQLRLGRTAVSNIIKAFCSKLESHGYFVGVYTSKAHFDAYVNEECRTKYTSWVAHYGVSKTTYTGPYDMWQKSSTGKIPGINGNVDLDECYKDFPSIMKSAGKNGFEKTAVDSPSVKEELVEPAPAPTEDVTPSISSTPKEFNVKIKCSSLNIRTIPSMSGKVVGYAMNGEVYTIIEEQNGWGKIKSKNNWISISPSYVTKL